MDCALASPGPFPLQGSVAKNWRWLQRLVEENGAAAVEAVRYQEKGGTVALKLGSFRGLLGLKSAAARLRILQPLRTAKNMDDVKKAATEIEKDMWVDWHWRAGNPFIPEKLGVCSCGPHLPTPGWVPLSPRGSVVGGMWESNQNVHPSVRTCADAAGLS